MPAASGFLRVAVRDAGVEVGVVAPLTDPEPGSDPDLAARTGVLASTTSAIAIRSGELPDPGAQSRSWEPDIGFRVDDGSKVVNRR
jgi:hypothetical protein